MREYDCIFPKTSLVSPYTFFRGTTVCLLKKTDSIGGSILLHVIKNFAPFVGVPNTTSVKAYYIKTARHLSNQDM